MIHIFYPLPSVRFLLGGFFAVFCAPFQERQYVALRDCPCVRARGGVAAGLSQLCEQRRREVSAENFLRDLRGAQRVGYGLLCLYAGNVVEEPGTGGVHEHPHALHFDERGSRAVDFVGGAFDSLGEERAPFRPRLLGAAPSAAFVKFYRVVAQPPRVAVPAQLLLEKLVDAIREIVESRAQRSSPFLIPALFAAGMAAAVAAPALDAVRAGPRAVLLYHAARRRAVRFEEFLYRGQRRPFVALQNVEAARERHLSELVVMPVALSVRRGDQKAVGAVGGGVEQSLCEAVAVVQHAAECYALRDAGVIKDDRERASRRQLAAVGARDVEPQAVGDVPRPLFRSHGGALPRRENRKGYAAGSERLECLGVHRALRQPHAFRLPPEAVCKIPDAPQHLSPLVPLVGERQDHVVVGLSDRARAVLRDRRVEGRRAALYPLVQRRAEVEGKLLVIIFFGDYAAVRAEYPSAAVRYVAFGRDPLVPIVRGCGGIVARHGPAYRVFARRLVEMSVNCDIYQKTILPTKNKNCHKGTP